jgi:hypothetical protein
MKLLKDFQKVVFVQTYQMHNKILFSFGHQIEEIKRNLLLFFLLGNIFGFKNLFPLGKKSLLFLL